MGGSILPVRPALLASLYFLATSVAAAQPALPAAPHRPLDRVTQLASASTGTIGGQVLDDRGQPLADVVVAAVGGNTSFGVTDRSGHYSIRGLPPGPYMVRAHLDGFLAARHIIVTVRPALRTASSFTLRRPGTASDPRLVAAGAAVSNTPPEDARAGGESETAWRLRRLKRSILKDATTLAEIPSERAHAFYDPLDLLGRAVESSARLASALFVHSPLHGQVRLLTTGAFDAPGELLQLDRTRGVAYFALGAPLGAHGDWSVKAALHHGDLSSWVVSGNYATRTPARHRYQVGMSYGLHRYEGGNLAALAAMPESARNVGSLYGADDWRVSNRVTVGYGLHYGHYDYLAQPAHLSPRVSVALTPVDHTRVIASASRRVSAPGADEFMPRSHAQTLPPQRTFAPLTRTGLLPQQTEHYELALERDFSGLTIAVRGFQQDISDQTVTMFGLWREDARQADLGHYVVASAGAVDIRGVGVGVRHALTPHVRGAVDYSFAEASWQNDPSLDRGRLARLMPSALRRDDERVHDLTTSLETELPLSATRVLFVYKMNSAYIRADGSESQPGLDGRWDVQVVQALPFLSFTSAQVEMLVGVRNLFRDSLAETSAYDELLVASPPKRLVGGVTVKF